MVKYIKDFRWSKNLKICDFVDMLGFVGFQSVELKKASDCILKMKKNKSKIFLTFTSNMVTSGLRGFFAQTIEKKVCDIIVTTIGGIEEDIMKSFNEKFLIGDFNLDDLENYESGRNRVGNLLIENSSYLKFENKILPILKKLYSKKKIWTPSEIFREIGLMIKDKNSILFQAAKNNVPIFCPAITDGSFGYHLFLFQQNNPDFIVDVVKDFKNIVFSTSQDDKKGIICLGGSISKHHAILSTLLNGGAEYAVYMTTSREHHGSLSGATTKEAKSWGKIKDESDTSTIIGDVTITYPLIMSYVFEKLEK